jgi:GNAT superfamily N-acetyltransferase
VTEAVSLKSPTWLFYLNIKKRGVGKLIMNSLVNWLKENAPVTAYVSLMADHGTPEFYEKFGFTKAELPKSSGMYMRIL